MKYTIRPARPEDVRPALALALRVVIECENDPLAVAEFRRACMDEKRIREHMESERSMFIALDGTTIVGMIAAHRKRGKAHINMLFVDPAYHRRGIATALTDAIRRHMEEPRLTVYASDQGMPFYLRYGFVSMDVRQQKNGFTCTPMEYTPPVVIRPARPEDVRPALELALRVFMIYSAPIYAPGAVEHFRSSCGDEKGIRSYEAGKALMFIAWDGENRIGMAAASWRRADKISDLFVDPAYHRQGIATKLMDTLIAAMGAPKITLGSSPYAVPFYLQYGFMPADAEQRQHGAIWTPMEYTPPVVIRPAGPEDVRPAIKLARRMCSGGVPPETYLSGQWRMFVACHGADIVGMVCEREGAHISRLCVEPAYQRQGIATRLMDAIIKAMAMPRITLNSSSGAVPFYRKYGCTPVDEEQRGMEYVSPVVIRPARPEDVRPALDFAQRIFEAYVLPDFDPPASERLGLHMDSEEQIQGYQEGKQKMFVAWAGPRIVGMVCERDNSHIRKLYVDGAWHRLGIATKLLDAIMQSIGAVRITLNSSRHGLPFYLKYGFLPTDTELNKDGFIFTPMAYETGGTI